MIKALIFDFDGIIVDSVNLKTEAFYELYKPFGVEVAQKVIKHHEANGGVSRFEKFKIYHENFLGLKLSNKNLVKLSKDFSKNVIKKIIKLPFVDGAEFFFSSSFKNYDFFISTGTPTDEINYILKKKNINNFFKGVYGSPINKDKHIKDIINKYHYKNHEIVFIGDSSTDLEAARINNLKFIGRFTTFEEIKKQKYLFENFYQLENLLSEIC